MKTDTALLVIDVQVGMFSDPAYPPYQGEALLANLSILIEKARSAGVPVIFIQHSDSSPEEPLWHENEGWQIHPAIAPRPGEAVVHKKTPDSFYETTLQLELEGLGIKHLVIAGMQTEFCVDTTTRQAFSRGYKITLVKDAHSTFDTFYLTAAQIINHHNNVLGGWFATVKETGEIAFSAA
ncbi:MAG: cysteine hydrolase [Chloroflexi bacterium]|uniref:Cysteine hydrolase n=1 Tax=Candidatus Chlorohelix allophototropha TaxID=3003348 RepID=A0A8T7M3Z1_9CHLR|nr:cysteine hydrolase [Chloroflexota bacterium]WJW70230.1 cysteine hydrolase [Chloroflexota bacterium L227-S17]